MPLFVSVYHPERTQWVQAGKLRPGDPPGSLSDNRPDGSRELYIFECGADDRSSVIYRSLAGADIADEHLRLIHTAQTQWPVVKRLGAGDTFELAVRTDRSPEPRQIRFQHACRTP